MAVCDRLVDYAAKGRLYDEVGRIPHREVGLVLGTSPISSWNGKKNWYFEYRMRSAAELYNAGKVDRLVVSGGNYTSEGGYDEPSCMRRELIARGVNPNHIIMDYGGTRTLNSIVKIHDVYHCDSIIIISQKFHNERALYQARDMGIDAIALNAKSLEGTKAWWRNRAREVLARVKLFIDLAIGERPEFSDD